MRSIEQEIAAEIAERLFTNGFGQEAQRLVHELPNKPLNSLPNGGGWCKEAVRDLVLDVIKQYR